MEIILKFLIILFISIQIVQPAQKRKVRQATSVVGKRCLQNLPKSYICANGYLSDIFDTVPTNAEILKVENISFPVIEDFTFRSYSMLTELAVLKANVSAITVRSFQGLVHLKTMNLSQNRISNLNNPYFNQLVELTTLNMSINKINSIANSALRGLEKLRFLDLSANQIESIPSGLFMNTPQIVKIDISQNKLTTIPTNMFNGLKNLNEINLADNRIVDIFDRSFSSLPVLQNLNLHGNKLHSLTPAIFDNSLQQLRQLFLSNNNLTYYLDIESFKKKIPSLMKVALAPNPWDCDCLNLMLEAIYETDLEYTPREYFNGLLPVCKVAENTFNSNVVQKCKSSPISTTSAPITTSSSKPTSTPSTTTTLLYPIPW